MKAVNKSRLAVSFSGGRTSAVMTKRLLEEKRHTHEITVNFANTGCEHEATLDFVNECDKRFGFGVVWLEAVIDPRAGAGIRHKVVSYETAARNGEPFEAYIAKYGIPNMGSPQCTSRLKEDVMKSYRDTELGWRRLGYKTAIGIRADEASRMNETGRFLYPLVEAGYTKEMVISEVRSWGFDLMIDEHYGNCTWCWKKSNRKLLTLAKENPAIFDFPARMEALYGDFKVTPATRSPNGRRQFFRGHRSAFDILELAREGNFEAFTDKYAISFDPDMDMSSGCGMSSCEVGHSS